ncbi:MFS family permease [Sporomusaceae bacterium BoRhaA]|uniref:MFS transporter n=1 Tax=Pelorhabdus rhamnosifermentans TaxID=2772457 RepID=UPI001C060697|nr:MFS transporter [Pelorhabdus rhamnosifermentans]MBU2703971.1 MFS family permease [Pelorhabdus rhamnosifermentans]
MEKTKLWTKDFLIDTIINFLLYLIYYLLMVIITVVAKDTLQASLSEAGLASGIFIVGTLFARLFVGKSIELLGRKKMLYAGIIFYFVTMLFYFDIKSLLILYIIRFLNGIGYGIASTATSTIVANIIPSTRRGEGINYYGLSTSVAAAVGPFLGMFLEQYMNFTFIVMFCVVLLLICLVSSLFLDVTEMKLSKEELAKLSRFSLDNFLEANVFPIAFIGLFMGFCYSSVLSFLAAYAQEINLVAAGTFFFVAYAVVITISRPFTGIIFDKKGENFVMYPCYICLAIGLFLLSQAHYGYVLLLAGVFVGLGYGTFMSNGQAICVKLSPYYRMGVATSTYFIALDLGLGVGPFLLGFLRPVIGFQGIYIVTAIVAFLCVFLYYALYGKKVGRMNCTTANCKNCLSGDEG